MTREEVHDEVRYGEHAMPKPIRPTVVDAEPGRDRGVLPPKHEEIQCQQTKDERDDDTDVTSFVTHGSS